ncbi:hypothetical protein FH972_006401 [Carpinus fangiana]|uniref:Transcription factor TFIIB cyclin-like domain-containing protein n=1 Tax=Carpinus fangiana TaxID=176857 RepID=A0A5N6QV49_9ROSI|nr:hypothetical protein FH972_006401 [Carpinus fangiana]
MHPIFDDLKAREDCRKRGKAELTRMASGLNITDGDDAFVSAFGYFEMAVSRRYFDNHSTEEVETAAACLYTACRLVDPTPLLLVDFSEFLVINVYVLGALLLQLCQDITFTHHLLARAKPFDPSLYFPRFAEELLKQRDMKVCETALHIIASMRSDRIEAGKIPSGRCGATLYISTLSHVYMFSEPDIVSPAHLVECLHFASACSG